MEGRAYLPLYFHAARHRPEGPRAVDGVHGPVADQRREVRERVRLAREERRHFEQVIKMMAARDIIYKPLSASRYAQGLHKGVRRQEPGRLIDTLIVGALIEARSCERFARLAPELDKELGDFYFSLLKSEARHYSDYLRLAESLASDGDLTDRLEYFRGLEAGLVESEDTEFRFHSGPVATQH